MQIVEYPHDTETQKEPIAQHYLDRSTNLPVHYVGMSDPANTNNSLHLYKGVYVGMF